jgi:AraC-like DNA-binding protein
MLIADIHILHQSDFYQVTDFKCHCDRCSVSQPEYNESLFISFIRKGFFEYKTFRKDDELHIGRLLVSKPGYEHVTRHIDDQPDITTGFEFSAGFFRILQDQYATPAGWFLKNNDIHSLMLRSNAELDYLHHHILQMLKRRDVMALQVDEMIMDLLEKVMHLISGKKQDVSSIGESLQQFHLGTVENARDYILQHFNEDISLHQLAQHCYVSPFHFSRIFKSVMNESPYQYLAEVRMNHAKILLTTTDEPVTDIAFACGYNSPEHFATAYRRRFKTNPSRYRKEMSDRGIKMSGLAAKSLSK